MLRKSWRGQRCVCLCASASQAMKCKCLQRIKLSVKMWYVQDGQYRYAKTCMGGGWCHLQRCVLECAEWSEQGQLPNASSALQHLSDHRLYTVFACIQIFRGVLTLPIALVSHYFSWKLWECGCENFKVVCVSSLNTDKSHCFRSFKKY